MAYDVQTTLKYLILKEKKQRKKISTLESKINDLEGKIDENKDHIEDIWHKE